MGAKCEFVVMAPRRADVKRNWRAELNARIAAETLIECQTVYAVAQRYELVPSTVSDWRGMARQGKLVLLNLEGMDFVPTQTGAPAPVAKPLAATSSGVIDVINGDVNFRLEAGDVSGADCRCGTDHGFVITSSHRSRSL